MGNNLHTSQKLLVNGRNLNVELFGQAQNSPVVLLHNGLGSTHSWLKQSSKFAEAGYFVVAYDRWGYGKSDIRPSIITNDFKEDINDLIGLLETLQIQRAAVIGHSDGGTLALYMAAQNPEKVSCLIAVAAHIYVESKMRKGIMQIRQDFIHNIWFKSGLELMHGEITQRMFSNWYDGWAREENLEWDMRPVIQNISCPTLVIQGEEDEHATPQHAKDIANAIKGAELVLIPNAKHLIPQDIPDIFNEKVLSFLKENHVQ